MRTAQIAGLLSAQPVFMVIAYFSELRASTWWIVLAHATVMLYGAAALRWKRIRANGFMALFFAAMMLDMAMSREITEPLAVLVFVTFVPAITTAIILSRKTLRILCWSIAVGVVASAAIVWFHPSWDRGIAYTSCATLLIVCVGVALLMSTLHRFTEAADQMNAEAAYERERGVSARALVLEATEGMRLLHDTVVNTLGSISSASPHMFDVGTVQIRCRNDLARVEAYLEGEADPLLRAFEWNEHGLLPVTEVGMGHEEFRRYVALLSEEAAGALHGCVFEALRNATKHSGAAEIVVETRLESNALVVTVRDQGRGFDLQSPVGQDLVETYRRRTERSGLRATLESEIGRGTRLRVSCPLDAVPTSARLVDDAVQVETIAAMRRNVSWIPTVPALGATLVEIAFQPADFPQVHLAFLITVVLALSVWVASRDGGPLPSALVILVVMGYPTTLLLSLRATEFPETAYAFPSVMFTTLPVIIHATTRSWRTYLVTLMLALIVIIWHGSVVSLPLVETVPLIGSLFVPVFCALIIWHIFDNQIRWIGGVFASDHHRVVEARVEAAVCRAAASNRARLSSAGLTEALALLRGIADGRLDPTAADVRSQCGAEESHLRQLLMLPTDAPHLSWALATAIARARSRGVRLRLQADGVAAMDAEDADAFGRVVLASIDLAVPEDELIVSVIQTQDVLRLLIVSEGLGNLPQQFTLEALPSSVTVQRFDSQTIIEVVAGVAVDVR